MNNKKRVLLEGPILTRSGYGEHCRLVFRALASKDQEVDLYVSPTGWGGTSWIFGEKEEDQQKDIQKINNCIEKFIDYYNESKANQAEMNFDSYIFVGILNEYERKANHSICVTAGIETDIVSSDWLVKTHQIPGPHSTTTGVDKIIVPSKHAKQGFDTTVYEVVDEQREIRSKLNCGAPVEVVNYPVKNFSNTGNLNLQFDTNFNFLFVGQIGPRKNIEALVSSYIKEFKDDKDVGLILKISLASSCKIDQEKTKKAVKTMLESLDAKNRKCKIYLLQGDLSDSEIHSLYTHESVKCYVTTTHGEGYGLPIFEAAYSGLPIVATDWSGHLDFLWGTITEGKSKKKKRRKLFAPVACQLKEIPKNQQWPGVIPEGSKWAFPMEASVRNKMRKVKNLHGMYKKRALALKEQLSKSHSEDVIYEKMYNAIFGVESIIDQQSNSNTGDNFNEEQIMVL